MINVWNENGFNSFIESRIYRKIFLMQCVFSQNKKIYRFLFFRPVQCAVHSVTKTLFGTLHKTFYYANFTTFRTCSKICRQNQFNYVFGNVRARSKLSVGCRRVSPIYNWSSELKTEVVKNFDVAFR